MQASKDDQDEIFTRQASGKSIRLSIAASLSKTIAAKGEIVKIDPSSQKLLGAIKQAKKEQEFLTNYDKSRNVARTINLTAPEYKPKNKPTK